MIGCYFNSLSTFFNIYSVFLYVIIRETALYVYDFEFYHMKTLSGNIFNYQSMCSIIKRNCFYLLASKSIYLEILNLSINKIVDCN